MCADILSNSAKLADAMFIVKPEEQEAEEGSEGEQEGSTMETNPQTSAEKETAEDDSGADPESKAI